MVLRLRRIGVVVGFIMLVFAVVQYCNHEGTFYVVLGAISVLITGLCAYLECNKKTNSKATIQAGNNAKIIHVQGNHNKTNIK
ncbi:hypothetical protein HK18_01930 [Commensalibacter intestini]|uniref:Uncharacterized protein n=1 Tax=Commensalibacter intestini TaxID=479936 RepID=A0A251ZXF2_9PROT|nr:hypothetical protein [Commensalibacter intestini]OUI79345.1 hypothetical protein HK18_01930 [Commensalibacter intestini]